MPVTRDSIGGPPYLKIDTNKFEIVHGFIYLESEVNSKSNVSSEIKRNTFSLLIDVSLVLENI